MIDLVAKNESLMSSLKYFCMNDLQVIFSFQLINLVNISKYFSFLKKHQNLIFRKFSVKLKGKKNI